MKEFTAIVPVRDSRYATELTLRTMFAVGKNAISELIILDSSPQEETRKFLLSFCEEAKLCGIPARYIWLDCGYGCHEHGMKLDAGILAATTPYVFLSDSDVEYFDGDIFADAVKQLNEDSNLAMVVGLIPSQLLGDAHLVRSPHLRGFCVIDHPQAWTMFARTEMFQDALNDGHTFKFSFELDKKEIHDCGANIYRELITVKRFRHSQDINYKSFHHYRSMTYVPPSGVEWRDPVEQRIKERIESKVWLNLNAVEY